MLLLKMYEFNFWELHERFLISTVVVTYLSVPNVYHHVSLTYFLTITSFFWDLPETVPILFHCLRKVAQPPLHDDDPPCSDYNNWIPIITYPTTFTSLLGLWTFFWFCKLGEWEVAHSLVCGLDGVVSLGRGGGGAVACLLVEHPWK